MIFDPRSKVLIHKPPEGSRHPAFGNESGCGEGYLHGQFRSLPVDCFTGMLVVDLVVKRPEHGAAFSSHLFLKALMQMCGEVADTVKPDFGGLRPPVEDTEDEDPGGQGATHASSGNSFHSDFVRLDRSTPPVKPGGHLGRGRLDRKLQNVCDRSEYGVASMISDLAVLIGQPACPLREGSDPAGGKALGRRCCFPCRPHFSMSSS